MRVHVHILGNPVDRPSGIGSDGHGDLAMPAGATLADLETRLELHRLGGASVMRNGAPVAPANRPATILADGDEIVVLPPIEGG